MKRFNRSVFSRISAIAVIMAMLVTYFPFLGSGEAYASIKSEKTGVDVIPSDSLGSGQDSGGLCYIDGKYMPEEELDAYLESKENAIGVTEVLPELSAQEVTEGMPETDLPIVSPEVRPDSDTSEASKNGEESKEALLERVKTLVESGSDSTEIKGDNAVVLHAMGTEEDGDSEEDPGYGMFVFVDLEDTEQGTATVFGYIDPVAFPNGRFTALVIDDDYITEDFTYYQTTLGSKEVICILESINMKDYSIGYHTVYLSTENLNPYYDSIGVKKVPTYIYEKPSVSVSDFKTDYDGIYYYGDDEIYYSDGCDYDDRYLSVYMQYKKGSAGWSKMYGPVGDGKGVENLSQTSQYSACICSGKVVTYDGETELFTSPASNAVSLKTGYTYTPIKSIKIKKVKQYSKKYRYKYFYKYWWVGNTLWGRYKWKTKRYWYTKVKVTVKMKKKPGVAGIYIGSKKASGNKKTYSKKFTLSGKKKGKKVKVSVQSYMSTVYGGWSKQTVKKVKVK